MYIRRFSLQRKEDKIEYGQREGQTVHIKVLLERVGKRLELRPGDRVQLHVTAVQEHQR